MRRSLRRGAIAIVLVGVAVFLVAVLGTAITPNMGDLYEDYWCYGNETAVHDTAEALGLQLAPGERSGPNWERACREASDQSNWCRTNDTAVGRAAEDLGLEVLSKDPNRWTDEERAKFFADPSKYNANYDRACRAAYVNR